MSETLTPRQLDQEGQTAFRGGRYLEAAATFERAAVGFTTAGDVLAAAESANNRSVALLKFGDAAGALQAALGTESIFAAGHDLRRQGMACANQAAALEGLGRLEEALDRYGLASDLLKQAGEKESRAMVLECITSLQLRTGKQLQALASMEAALDHKPHLSLKDRLLRKLLQTPLGMLRRKE
jgi:tetratricopeptide (TPR) repeat protein